MVKLKSVFVILTIFLIIEKAKSDGVCDAVFEKEENQHLANATFGNLLNSLKHVLQTAMKKEIWRKLDLRTRYLLYLMNVPKFLAETELLIRTYEKDVFDKKIGDLCIESTENDTWLESTLFVTIELGNLLRPFFEVKEYLHIIRTG